MKKATLPEQWKSYGAGTVDFNKVGERRRLYRWVRSTFPTQDVTRQLTYFRRITKLLVFHGDDIRRDWFRHRNAASRAFHYLADPRQNIRLMRCFCTKRRVVTPSVLFSIIFVSVYMVFLTV